MAQQRIQLRRDTAANWTSANPTLAEGEFGYETDTGNVKFGDGATVWTSLGYFAPGSGLSDGDKGDITVSGGGGTWTIDNGAVTAAKVAADVATQAELDAVAAAKADTAHAHAAADVTSGTMATARLGSGTADATTFLRGDQTWATPAGGSGEPSDGDKGDIMVSSSGTVWMLNGAVVAGSNIINGEVSTAKIANGAVTAAKVAADVATQAELDAVAAASQPLDADLTALAAAGNSAVLAATTASFLLADETKLDGIEALADVTDATNVAAAGALMKVAAGAAVENLGAVEFNVNVVAATGATETLDTSLYGVHDCTMDQACTFTFSNPAPSGKETEFKLILRGAFTPTLPASVDWGDATAPTYATPSVYYFSTVDAGTTWLGVQAGKAFG